MPNLTIINLNPGDTQEVLVNKINQNFGSIVASGGGPQGQEGSQGDQGTQGVLGDDGTEGVQGPAGGMQKYAETAYVSGGSSETISITHNLSSYDLVTMVYYVSSGERVIPNVILNSLIQANFEFNNATAGNYSFVIGTGKEPGESTPSPSPTPTRTITPTPTPSSTVGGATPTPTPTITPTPSMVATVSSYFYSESSTNWFELSNWFANSSHTIAKNSLPNSLSEITILGPAVPYVDIDNVNWVNPATINIGNVGITFTSALSGVVTSTITGTASATFLGTAQYGN